MRRAWLLAALCALGSCERLTYLVVRVDSVELMPPELTSISIRVTNPELGADGGPETYSSQPLRLCATNERDGCYRFPVTVTLKPGELDPRAKLRIEVEGFDASGVRVTRDATVTSFTAGQGKIVDFFLFKTCLNVDCAVADMVCGSSGTCRMAQPRDEDSAPPDFAVPPPSGEVRRVSLNAGILQSVTIVPPPVAEAGDLILLGVNSFQVWYDGTNAPGWQLFGQLTNGTVILYRFAVANERDLASLYRFDLPGAAVTHGYVVVSYRGVRRLRAGVSARTPPWHVTAVPDLSPGGVVVGMAAGEDAVNGEACNEDPHLTLYARSGSFDVFEVLPEYARTLSFDLADCTSARDLYQVILEP